MDNRRNGQSDLPTSHVAEQQWNLWDRRGFIAAGAALGASAGLTAPAAAATVLMQNARFHMVIADTRFAESHAFAAEAARAGNRVGWITGDITKLWYDDLDLLWREKKAPITGLTGYAAFFCLERLAWDRGLHVAFKEEHQRTEGEQPSSLYRWIIAPKPGHRTEGCAA